MRVTARAHRPPGDRGVLVNAPPALRSFDWASGTWEEGDLVVSVTDRRPNPRGGQPAGPPLPGGDQPVEDYEFRTQHLGCFAIAVGLADDEAAEAVVARVRATEPEQRRPPRAPNWHREPSPTGGADEPPTRPSAFGMRDWR